MIIGHLLFASDTIRDWGRAAPQPLFSLDKTLFPSRVLGEYALLHLLDHDQWISGSLQTTASEVNLHLHFSKDYHTVGITCLLSIGKSNSRFSKLNDTAKETKY